MHQMQQSRQDVEMDDTKNPTAILNQMLEHYLKQDPGRAGADYQTKNVPELEVRFGTAKGAGSRTYTKVD